MTRNKSHSLSGVVAGMVAAFATYFCMYAFRKPFTAGTYEDHELWGVDYKIVLIIAQVLGYTLSKFSGIKIISEMPPHRRIAAILIFIGIAQVALVLFGLIPAPYNFVCLFLNGLPLGLIWGLVFSFVEGRRHTELLGATLCVSFIVASGVVKSVGTLLMTRFGVGEFWMPAATGLVFALPLLLAVAVLSRMPPPTEEDERTRTRRVPMSRRQRSAFFRRFAPGIVLLMIIYAALNAYRDFRDNFAAELWTALGYINAPAIFTLSEVPIALITLLLIGSLVVIRNNQWAFWTSLGTVVMSGVLVGVITLAYRSGMFDPTLWMIVVGLGMYVPYIAFHVMVFERMIAVFRQESNVGYLMYVADACGYLASCVVMLYRNFGAAQLSWLEFFVWASYALAIGSVLLALLAAAYFRRALLDTLSAPSTIPARVELCPPTQTL